MSVQRNQVNTRALANLRRIEGQVRALQRQLEGNADFLSLLTQIAAASKGLQSVARKLVEERVADPELIRVVDRLLKV